MPLKDRLGLAADPLYLIDGSAFLYRGFHAYPDLKRSDGAASNALYIVLRILLRILREEKPRHLAFFLDGRKPNYRHARYPAYKANRPKMPEPLAAQIDPLLRAVKLLGLSATVSDGVEADDCIASLAARFKAERPVVIVAADKDLKQCLDQGVYLWDPAGKKESLSTAADFTAETGLAPGQWPDFQALTGDSADNIPGAPGIGKVSAAKLMAKYPSLEALRDNVRFLPPRERAKIEPELDNLFLYRELTRLSPDACPGARLEDYRVRPPDGEGLLAFLDEWEFRSFRREAEELVRTSAAAKPAAGPLVQGSLLDAAPAAAAPPLEVIRAARPEDLPDLTGKTVGLVAEGGPFLGLEGREYRWGGPVSELVPVLSRAACLAAPSLMDLYRADPAWRGAPLALWFDLGLAAYLLNPEDRGYGFDRLRAGLAADPQAPAVHPEARGLAALALLQVLRPRLESAHLSGLMADLETPLVPVLADMEAAGIAIDHAAFASFLAETSASLEDLTRRIHELAGGPFNVRSSQQLAQVLFEKLGLKPAGKTPGGAFSTGGEVLERLAGKHEIVDALLEYRKLEKLRSTYLEPLPRLAGPDGRIRTRFNQLATATGRLSSSGPNLQNIPVRGDLGRRMRACFTAAPGKLLASADYSQIELRVLAHFSGDPTLRQAFAAGEDIHTRTAALLFDKAPKEIGPDERRSAKTINFGLIYGMGPQKLARELSITVNEAKAFIERYFERLSTLKEFYEGIVARAEAEGYVTTLAGRRRLLPELSSRNEQMAAQARRQAVNTVIQGSAADVIKLAMLQVAADPQLKDLGAVLVLQIHDELLLEAPEETARAAGERLAGLMRDVTSLGVPLKADLGVGRTWGEAH